MKHANSKARSLAALHPWVLLALGAVSACGGGGGQQNTGGGGGGGGDGTSGGTGGDASPTLQSLHLEPASGASTSQLTLKLGETVQLKALAVYSDGSETDVTSTSNWSTANGSLATVAAGLVSANTVGGPGRSGYASITASVDGRVGQRGVVVDDYTTLTVTPDGASPELGQTQAYVATGKWFSGTTEDVSAKVAWASTSPSVATITDAGVATVVGVGNTRITATLPNGVNGSAQLLPVVLQSIAITSAGDVTSVPAGVTVQLTATGTYFNSATTRDLTATVAWTTSNSTVATIAAGGLVTTLKAGNTSLTATDTATGRTRTFSLNVSTALLSSLSLTALATSDLFAGQSVKVTATGTYSDASQVDVSDKMTWSSNATPVVTVNPRGWVTGVGLGVAATITATPTGFAQADVLPASWPLTAKTVTGLNVIAPVVVSMHVFPKDRGVGYQGRVPVTAVASFTAWGSYSDGTTRDETANATWSSGAMGTAISLGEGRFKGVAVGATTVTASLGGKSGTQQLDVFAASGTTLLLRIEGAYPNCLLARESLRAIPTRLFGTSAYDVDAADVTGWASSNPSNVSVSSTALLSAGTANGSTATITFSYLAPGASVPVTGSQSITVKVPDADTAATYLTTGAVAANQSLDTELPIGASRAFRVGTTACSGRRAARFVTTTTWDSTATTTATVVPLAGLDSGATVKALAAGSATISVAGPLARTVSIDVFDAWLKSLSLSPVSWNLTDTLATGRSLSLRALGRYELASGGVWKNNVVMLGPAVWTSSNPDVAIITPDGSLHAVGPGTADIAVHAEGLSVKQPVKVSNIASVSIASPIHLYPDTTDLNTRSVSTTLVDGTVTMPLYPFTWAIADTSVATLDTWGRLVGGAPGTTTLTVTDSVVSSRTATATLIVHDLTSLAASPTPVTLYGLGTVGPALTLTVTYDDATTSTTTPLTAFTLSSADTTVATVGLYGQVTGGAAFGSTTLTAKSVRKTSVSATIPVSVPVPTTVTLSPAAVTLSATSAATKTQQFSVQLGWAGTTTTAAVASGVPWNSSTPAVATVSTSGLVTAVAAGSTTLSAPGWTYGGQALVPTTAAITVTP